MGQVAESPTWAALLTVHLHTIDAGQQDTKVRAVSHTLPEYVCTNDALLGNCRNKATEYHASLIFPVALVLRWRCPCNTPSRADRMTII